ncbi:MAG: histidine phosphatase family protein [Sulfitobacter sp.]
MTRWHWVRHGPTHEKAFTGWRDVPADLSDHAQLAQLNAFLPEKSLIIASDLCRASATADALKSANRSRLPDNPDLREFDFGIWDGMEFSAVAARDPALSRAYWETPGDIRAPQGESWNDAAARVAKTVDNLNAQYPDRDIIAVAHFGVILTQIQQAQGITPHAALSQLIDNLSVTRLTHEAGVWSAPLINHLP